MTRGGRAAPHSLLCMPRPCAAPAAPSAMLCCVSWLTAPGGCPWRRYAQQGWPRSMYGVRWVRGQTHTVFPWLHLLGKARLGGQPLCPHCALPSASSHGQTAPALSEVQPSVQPTPPAASWRSASTAASWLSSCARAASQWPPCARVRQSRLKEGPVLDGWMGGWLVSAGSTGQLHLPPSPGRTGWCNTAMASFRGPRPASEGADTPVWLAFLPGGAPGLGLASWSL